MPQSIDHSYVIDGFESTLHVPQQPQRSIFFANDIIQLSSQFIAPVLSILKNKTKQKGNENQKNKQTRIIIPPRISRTIPEHVWRSYEGIAPINVIDEIIY